MKKNILKEIFTEENKYENYILLILSIIGFILGVLLIFNVIALTEDFKMDPKLFGCIIAILSLFSGFLSIKKIIKNIKYNKIPKPLLYNMFKNEHDTKSDKIIIMFAENGYPLITEDDYPIFYNGYEKEYTVFTQKDNIEIWIGINVKYIEIELGLSDELDEQVSDDFYEYEDDLFSKTIDLDLNTGFDTLINYLNLFYEEKASILLERYEKYKNK